MGNATSVKSLPQPFSPPSSDTTHRISHLHHAGEQGVGIQRKTMTPEEVVDVARGLISPVAVPEGGFNGAELKRRKSAGASSRRSFGGKETSAPEKPPMALEPVEYVQLDDETLLPYVERPAEVSELLKHPSNEKLFNTLKAAFPKDAAREHWMALDPEEWRWDELIKHLTTLSRVECPDYAWVFRARQAVRARSVALWEKVGVCLGCDGELLNAGGEDGLPPSWGGLSLGEEGEYDPSQNQVWIEGLEAVDPEEQERMEKALREEFGEIVEDEGEQAAAGMTALLGTIGEGEEEVSVGRPKLTTAQQAANKAANLSDPLLSPSVEFQSATLPRANSRSPRSPSNRPIRSRSFVGLQILTSPNMAQHAFPRSPSSLTPGVNVASLPVFDRGPGSPLFPSGFASLSAEPNLGRSASVGIAGGIKAAPDEFGRGGGGRSWSGLRRKGSGAGLSESELCLRGCVC